MKSLRLSITPGYVAVQVTSAFDTTRDTTGKSLAAVLPAMTTDDRMDLRDVCRLILNLTDSTAAADLDQRRRDLDARPFDAAARCTPCGFLGDDPTRVLCSRCGAIRRSERTATGAHVVNLPTPTR